MILLPQKQMGDWQPYVFYKEAFSPSECEAIIHIAKSLKPESAFTGTIENPSADKSIRSSELRWLKHQEKTEWVFDKLAQVVGSIQQNWYPFALSGFQEPIQITHYKASEGGHYKEHRDFGPGNMSTRKLSLVMLLNDAQEFKGGELEILSKNEEDKAIKEVSQGALIAFPSWELHRVRRVTEGQRWSLVCWVHGDAFR